jgi:hypothetical protein
MCAETRRGAETRHEQPQEQQLGSSDRELIAGVDVGVDVNELREPQQPKQQGQGSDNLREPESHS